MEREVSPSESSVRSRAPAERGRPAGPFAARWMAVALSVGLGSPAVAAEFMGRTIAPTMSHRGANWLTRPERAEEENTERLLEELRLSPGDVACDLGAGNGYHTLRMAKRVAPDGEVVAVDIQPEMLELLRGRAREAGIENVKTVLGAEDDPKLGANRCDLVLLVDVYHELSDPPTMLAHLKRALRPGGSVALVEFRAEDPRVPIKPLHKMTKSQMKRELASAGFEAVRSFDRLPWQHLVFFAPLPSH